MLGVGAAEASGDRARRGGGGRSARRGRGGNPAARGRRPRIARSRYEISAGGVIWRPGLDGTVEVCLIATHQGRRWALPKGHVEPGEGVETAAEREVREETGLQGRCERRLGRHEYRFLQREDGALVRIVKLFHVCLLRWEKGEPTPELGEVDDARWFPIDEAIAQAAYDSERQMLVKARAILCDRPAGGP